jgi:integrase
MKTKSFGSLVLRGSRYHAFWRVNGKAISRALKTPGGASCTTKEEAEQAKAVLMGVVAKSNQVETLRSIQENIEHLEGDQRPSLTLAETWSHFLQSSERRDCSKASLRQYSCKWGIFVEWMKREHPEAKHLRDVTPAIAESFLQSLNHGKVAPGTFNFMLFILRYVFRTLSDDAKPNADVWKKAQNKAKTMQSRRELTIDELQRVCGSARGELKTLFAIGCYTGLRLGDVATLKWCEVDLRRNQIRRTPRKTANHSARPIVIPMHPALRVMLAELPANERDKIYVLPKTASTYLSAARTVVSASIQRHFKANGIETTAKRETGSRPVVLVGFHSLRHTFVSMCREANVPLSVVESLVGHSNVAMTQHYTHVSEQAAQSAIRLLPAVNGDVPATTKPASLRDLIESMTPENLHETKSAALAMLAQAVN